MHRYIKRLDYHVGRKYLLEIKANIHKKYSTVGVTW